ncbi:hypothetical protein L1987_19099 [Smallanthus sonchifolius]|uniref:Uncharacterized protein n=1 Tax=Smallanthus sonchifolius TaxID=185202 RepID=A0ACB9J3M5_9ASTR|nr:hypothetical protein L1987_19099 [Smallanthus sonchifolius]
MRERGTTDIIFVVMGMSVSNGGCWSFEWRWWKARVDSGGGMVLKMVMAKDGGDDLGKKLTTEQDGGGSTMVLVAD